MIDCVVSTYLYAAFDCMTINVLIGGKFRKKKQKLFMMLFKSQLLPLTKINKLEVIAKQLTPFLTL